MEARLRDSLGVGSAREGALQEEVSLVSRRSMLKGLSLHQLLLLLPAAPTIAQAGAIGFELY